MKVWLPLIALAAALPPSSFADNWNKHFDISGKPELHVIAGDAAVSIHAGSGSGIEATVKTRGLSIGSGGVQVKAEQNGNRVDLEVRIPQQHFSWGDREVRLEIAVPPDVAAYLRTGDGPISIQEVRGSVQAQTGDGPVRVEQFTGSLNAQTGNGPVDVQGKFSDLQIKTGDGPVRITADSGSKIQTAWRLHTGDGPVSIKVPSSLSADVSLHTGDGPIAMKLPLTSRNEQDRHNVHGKLNGGGPELSVHTGDGPISISQS